jgi:hypothetical protein
VEPDEAERGLSYARALDATRYVLLLLVPFPGVDPMLTPLQMLSASDLQHDPILVRKIKRLQAQAARVAEESDIDEDEDEDEVQHRGSQKVRNANVKSEPRSSRLQVPAM